MQKWENRRTIRAGKVQIWHPEREEGWESNSLQTRAQKRIMWGADRPL